MSHDMTRAKAFYGGVFGWDAADMDTQGGPAYAGFDLGGKRVAGLGEASPEMKAAGMPAAWNSYISVDDVAATCETVKAAGGAVVTEPFRILDAGRMAVVRDPTGGHVCLWQAIGHRGVDVANEAGTWVWGELLTPDPRAAMTFYGEAFGWTFDLAEGQDDYWEHKVNGRANGGLMKLPPEMGGVPPHWSVYFMVADADAAVAKVREHGGSVMQGPFDTHVGKIAICADPDGAAFNVIALTVPVDDAPSA